jgi:hypothetical protein
MAATNASKNNKPAVQATTTNPVVTEDKPAVQATTTEAKVKPLTKVEKNVKHYSQFLR